MLEIYKFKSIFKDELNNFISMKRSQGYDYKNEVYRLNKLDEILFNSNLRVKRIKKETFYNLTKRNNMEDANYARLYGITKDFCKYLITIGYKDIYYEEKKFHIKNNYIPVMFNKTEITLLFNLMDKYNNNHINSKYYNQWYTYSIAIRLIYACGLRISEIINIKYEDVDLEQNTINIIDSKKHISRLVVFSSSMKKCLKNYLNKFNINNGLLFINKKGNIISSISLRNYYKKILGIANLNTNARIHDLRHVFTNYALNQMLDRGYEERVAIVYLYKYMGHKSIRETEYYLHFTDYNKKKLIESNDAFSKKLYEGVDFCE